MIRIPDECYKSSEQGFRIAYSVFHLLKVYSVYITQCASILYSVKDLYSDYSVNSLYSDSLCATVDYCIRQLNTDYTVLYSGL